MRVENDLYRVDVNPKNGAIRGLFDKAGKQDIIAEPRLAESFRLLLPLPGMHANYIMGVAQKLTSLKKTRDGATLRWDGPLVNERGKFDLAVTARIEFAGEAVQCRISVENRTKFKLAEVWYPILGGMMGLGNGDERKQTTLLIPHGFTQWTRDIFRDFGSDIEWLGCLTPEHAFPYPGWMPMPWCCFYHRGLKRGLYFAAHDREPRAKVLRFSMEPGIAHGRVGGNWPRPDELNGRPAGVTMNWTSFPYAKPGETFDGPPVVLQCHEGDWRRAAAIYRAWFTASFPVVDSRKHWLRKASEFMDTMFMLPEDNVNITYAEIPRWAKTAADYGLKSVLISGWQVGGHDRGYPQYEPDPRLGTWKELEAGIRACHKMGVRVYFFANVQPADITTEWYRKELHKYIVMDPWGNPYYLSGWGMGTLGARKNLTRVNSVEMSPAHPEVRAIILRYMRKLAEIGADGVHFDKLFAHPMDFNPRLKTSPDRGSHAGILQCMEEVLAACRAINPEFCISYENNWDRLMSYSDVCWWAGGLSAMKEVFPQWMPAMSVNQPYDFNMANLAVLRGHCILVGPGTYMRGMDYEPMRPLFEYIREIVRIRAELHDVLSRGEVVGSSEEPFVTDEPAVRMGGSFARDTNAKWTVFRDVNTGRRAAVLANLGDKALRATKLTLPDLSAKACDIHQPFAKTRRAKFPAAVAIPAERVAVVVER